MTVADPLRVLIVDDEPLARQHLRSLLADDEVDVVGESADGTSAAADIERLHPDLVFLDIQMPDFDGFELLRRINRGDLPMVIFTTAFDEHALRAFEAQALDYLLKPVDPKRLRESIRRSTRFVHGPENSSASPMPHGKFRWRIAARAGQRTVLLDVEDVDWIEPVSNYAKLHVGTHSYYLRTTITALQTQLDPERFLRIDRSTIVNVDRIVEITRDVDRSDYIVVLTDATRLRMKRPYARRLKSIVGNF